MAEDISRKSTNVVLDPEISSEIISKAIEESAFMQLADRMTIAGNGKKYQTIEGDPVPEWVGETDPAPVGKFSFGKKVIEPYKMELIVPFSNEFKRDKKGLYEFDYQSERHCSKTKVSACTPKSSFDYQSERHCSKTRRQHHRRSAQFDYQSERHCSKTNSPI